MRFKKEITIPAFFLLVCCSKSQDINANRYPYGRNPNDYDSNVPRNNYPYSSTQNPYNSGGQNDVYGSGVNGQYSDTGGSFGQSPRPTVQYGGQGQFGQYPEQGGGFPQSPRQYPDTGGVFGQSPRPTVQYGGQGQFGQYPEQGGGGFPQSPRQYPDQTQTSRPNWRDNFGGGVFRNQFDEHSTIIVEP